MRTLIALSLYALATSTLAQEQPPLPESPNSTLGYPTVAAALSSLRTRPDVQFSVQNGWTVAVDEKAMTIWSFSSSTYPAYPAVVKRQVVANQDGGSDIKTSVLCEAEKRPCDDLVRTFNDMTARTLGPSAGPPKFH
jgi:hypothetical protein